MKSTNDKLSSFRRWMVVLVIAVLAVWFVISTNIKNGIAYTSWINTTFMVGKLREHLRPEYVASKIAPSSRRDEVLLRTDWKFDDFMVLAIDMPRSIATPNKDGWGSFYYVVCDFNNDGQIPNPETLTTPPNPGAVPTLKARIAVFSAGPDGDPGDLGRQRATSIFQALSQTYRRDELVLNGRIERLESRL